MQNDDPGVKKKKGGKLYIIATVHQGSPLGNANANNILCKIRSPLFARTIQLLN